MSGESRVLDHLLASNVRWAEAMDPNFWDQTGNNQGPKVLWIGCSDSRVPEAVVTGAWPAQGNGDIHKIFTHRNIANQFRLNDPSLAAIVQFAVRNLGVQHIVIVGHTNCGGVRGALEAVFPPQAPKVEDGDPESAPTPSLNIPPALGDWLQPLIEDIKNTQPPNPDLDWHIDENVRRQVDRAATSEVVTSAWAEKNPTSQEFANNFDIRGWVYDVRNGRLKDLNHIRRRPN